MVAKNRVTTHDALARILQLPESFAEAHIPLREHLGDGIFLLASGELGVVYEVEGIYDELLSESELQAEISPFMKFLRQIVVGIPNYAGLRNTVIQLICSQRTLSEIPSPVRVVTTEAGAILRTEEERLFGLGLVQRRYFLTVRYTPTRKSTGSIRKVRGVFEVFQPDGALRNRESDRIHQSRAEFEETLRNLEAEFATARSIRRVSTVEILSYYEDVLHGAKKQNLIFDTDKGLHEAIYTSRLRGTDDGVEIEGGGKITPFVLAQLPGEYAVGLLRHFIDSLPMKNFDLVWGFSHGSRDLGSALAVKSSWFGHSPAHKGKYEDLVSFQNNLDALRPHGVQSLRLLTYDIDDAMKARIQTLAMDHIGARLIPERQIGVHMVVSSLPLCLSREGNRITGRSRQIRLENSVGFWPLYDGPSRDHGLRWHCSRTLTPTRFDLFRGEGNRMTTVLGTSRAGKSCLMNQLLLEFMERFPQGVIRIIDKKTSYFKLADLLGGKIVSFSEKALRESPYSPFALDDWEDDDIEGIYVLLATSLVQKNPGVELTSLHTELLRDAIKIAYNNQLINIRYANRTGDKAFDAHPIWPNVLAALPQAANLKAESGIKGADAAREELAAWSVSLGPSGQYGFIFSAHERHETSTEAASFLVYDLDGISDPVLQLLAGQMAFLKITRDLAKLPRSTPKLIVFEELGMLLHGDSQAQKLNTEFIQNVVKTCAKLNAQAISLTNGVGDYLDKPAGKTLWTIATQKLFLPLGDAMVSDLKEKCGAEFSEAEFQILSSLEINRRLKRSELYVRSENSDASYRGTIFLPLSPSMDALVTSSGSQVELYNTLKARGLSPKGALEVMAQEYPYGEAKADQP
jgi:type IV secretory pathway VirB4 component